MRLARYRRHIRSTRGAVQRRIGKDIARLIRRSARLSHYLLLLPGRVEIPAGIIHHVENELLVLMVAIRDIHRTQSESASAHRSQIYPTLARTGPNGRPARGG